MPTLKNKRHEQFCQALVRGMSAVDAYISAGFESRDKGTAQPASARLRQKPQIKQRIAELEALAENLTIATSAMDLNWWRATVMDTIALAGRRGDLNTVRALLETSGKHLGAFDADKVSYSGTVADRKLDPSADDTEVAAMYRELLASQPTRPDNVAPIPAKRKA